MALCATAVVVTQVIKVQSLIVPIHVLGFETRASIWVADVRIFALMAMVYRVGALAGGLVLTSLAFAFVAQRISPVFIFSAAAASEAPWVSRRAGWWSSALTLMTQIHPAATKASVNAAAASR